MPRTKHTVTIHQTPVAGSSSQSNSFSEDESLDDSYDYTEPDDEYWEDEDDLQPSDSASALNDHAPPPPRVARRAHRVVPEFQRQHHHPSQGHQPQTAPSVDPNEDWGHYGRGYHAQHHQGQAAHAPYIAGQAARGNHGYHQQQQQQQQNHHVGPYMGGYHNGNQMVPYANYANNPFSPMGNGSNGNNYFGNEGRPMYDMMPYQQQHGAYYGNPQHFGVPAQLQQFHMAPPVPAPTEHPGRAATPPPKEPPPPDPDKIRLEAEIAAFKAHEEKAKAAEMARELEAQIRKDAEDQFQRRMEDMRRAQEEAKKEIELAKIEAERAARERIEAERKAEDERQKAHAEAMQRAEQNARLKFEAEMKAAEERRQKEEEDRKRAEETARIRLEAAIKAEAEAKAAADKRAAEEVARLKQIEEDAKRRAEADAAAKVEKDKADAVAAAEAEAAAKKAAEELKKKIQEETRIKLEEAKKKSDKPPIKFKDAVGRKFSFPFHLCATWQGMEDLIKQAFLQVDVLGPHVQEGHYDLIGPNGEIILPSVWERVVEPDWSITMTMWPIDKSPPVGPRMAGPMGGKHGHGIPMPPPPRGMPQPGRRPGGIPVGMPPMAPGWPGGPARPPRAGPPHGIEIVNTAPPKAHKKEKRQSASVLTFLAGKPSKKKSSKK